MIKVIGIGPGGKEDMTPRALNAILEADTVAGYNTYIKIDKTSFRWKKCNWHRNDARS